MNPMHEKLRHVTRRHFLRESTAGIGGLALAMMLRRDGALGGGNAWGAPAGENPLAPRAPHYPARAKNVIYLHMAGSPPQQELFDHKPMLQELNGKPCPDEYLKGERFAFIKGHPELLGSPYRFSKHGESGQVMSELL